MIDALFDTNIVIYLSQKDERHLRFFWRTFKGKVAGVSVVTYIEAMIGVEDEKEEMDLLAALSHFQVVPLELEVARQSVMTFRIRAQKSLKNPYFADTLIAHTALALGIPLVTNNPKDFAAFKKLKLIVP